jgi:hypothetical protein
VEAAIHPSSIIRIETRTKKPLAIYSRLMTQDTVLGVYGDIDSAVAEAGRTSATWRAAPLRRLVAGAAPSGAQTGEGGAWQSSLKQFLSALSSRAAPAAGPSGPAGAAAPEPADLPDYCFACPRCKAVMRKGLLLCLNCYSAFKFKEGLSAEAVELVHAIEDDTRSVVSGVQRKQEYLGRILKATGILDAKRRYTSSIAAWQKRWDRAMETFGPGGAKRAGPYDGPDAKIREFLIEAAAMGKTQGLPLQGGGCALEPPE